MHGAFSELAVLLLICALAGALFVRLRQPVLIAYIVVGIAVGPAVFGLVSAHDQIDLLAQVGVAEQINARLRAAIPEIARIAKESVADGRRRGQGI